MSVSTVRVISIIGVLSELDKIVKFCGESQVFHPDNALSFYKNTDGFVPLSDKNPYSVLLDRLREHLASSGKEIETTDVHDFDVTLSQINEYVDYLSLKLDKLLSEKQKISDRIDYLKKNIDVLKNFEDIDVDLQKVFSCEYIKARFGNIPKGNMEKLDDYKDNPYILFLPYKEDENFCWGVYFAPLEYLKEVDKIFSSLCFQRADLSGFELTPKQQISSLQNEVEVSQKEFDLANRKLNSFWKIQYDQCIRFYSKLEELDTYFSIKSYVFRYNNSFILVGWIPAESEDYFSNKLKTMFGVEYSIDSAEDELQFSPPVILKNKKVFKPFEFFIDMYGLPCYNEIDPTIFVSITFTILFGIMFGDVGQGLVLSVVGYFMWKIKRMPIGKVLMPCGVVGSLFGVLYGSVFGLENLLDGFYSKFFGLSEKPIDVMEADTTMKILGLSISIGVVMLTVCMLMNIFVSLRKKDYESALFGQNGVCGLMFYSSVVVGLVAQLLLGVKLLTIPYVLAFIVIPIVCMIFKGILGKLVAHDRNWKPKSMGEYLLENVFEMFEVILSYLSNTVSFLRIGIYVLVHAGLMMAVSALADIAGIMAMKVLIFVIGNVVVIALEGLLVGIQSLRLNFYEMFSRFYEGGGRPFKPITIKEQKAL